MPEEINPYRPKYRNAFKDSLTFEQNQRHRSDNRSDGPHLKMKKRVLTERELREEEEFRRSSVEEVDARDRFGDYGDDTGNEMRDGQYKTDDRNANYDNRMRHEQYRTDDRVARYDNRMRHEQYQREAPRRNWSDTFGTISLEDKPSLGDVLFGKEPPPRYDKFVLIFNALIHHEKLYLLVFESDENQKGLLLLSKNFRYRKLIIVTYMSILS